jgi:hypothetical protein
MNELDRYQPDLPVPITDVASSALAVHRDSVHGQYVSSCEYGEWATLPLQVRNQLAGYLTGYELASWVEPSQTVRPGITYLQRKRAWWASAQVLLTVEATRPLRALTERRMTPAGNWEATATVYLLAPARVQTLFAARRTGRDQALSNGRIRVTRNALELLPSKLRAHVLGGRSGALLDGEDRAATEVVMACRVRQREVCILRAWRGPARRDALPSQPWEARVLTTFAGEVAAVDVSKGQPGRQLLNPG